jgi:energy-coupling factor transport system ATP-binding protein
MGELVVENLKYRYPLSQNLALNDLSFQVKAGEFIGIVGANNAGKSTLCQALTGLVPQFYHGAYGGRVLVDGLEVAKVPLNQLASKIGIVFQNPFTQLTQVKLTVYEEIAFGLENMGLSRPEMIDRIEWVLKLLHLEQFKEKNPFTLSGGQMQRLAIASIIALQPEIIVLDEPTSQLDPQSSEEIFQVAHLLSEQGLTVIIAEHKMEKVCQYADRILLLHQGQLMVFDTPHRVFSQSDWESYGIPMPVFTNVCKQLKIKQQDGSYPITLEEACQAIRGYDESKSN